MPNHNPLIVALHGATGTQGLPVARRLLSDGHRVRALFRQADRSHLLPAGCEPFVADMLDAGALARAYAGVDVVVVQLPQIFDELAVRQAERVGDALRRSAVQRVVFNTSGPSPTQPTGVPYLDARFMLIQALQDAPFSATVVAPVAPYMENLLTPWLAALMRKGVLVYPLPAEAPIPWVALDDIAEHIAAALTGDEPGPVLIAGPQALTGPQVAATLASARRGRPLRWQTLHPAEYGDLLRPHTGDQIADGIAGLYRATGGPPPAPDPNLLHIGRTTLESWARTQAWDECEAPAATR